MNKSKKKPSTPADTLAAIDAETFALAIEKAEIHFQPAFVHGLLTAYCCDVEDAHGWATALVDNIDPDNDTLTEQLRYLNQARNTIGTQLADSQLGFPLLLHNTAETLHDEVLLTREWASGYYLGVQNLQLSERVAHDDLSVEFLQDLSRIVAMPLPDDDALDAASISDDYSDQYDDSDDIYDADTGDDTRTDILEIQEYCRAGAIGVFLASWRDSQQS